MWAVAPEVKTIQQPVQLLHAQHDSFIAKFRRCFETLGLQALEPKTKAVALPIKDFHSITVAIQKNEQHGIEYRDLDIQFDEGGQAVDGFSEVHGFGVQINFFHFCVGSHHDVLAP